MQGRVTEQPLVYANRRRVQGRRGKELQTVRSELVERSFAHLYETGGMRRNPLRKTDNIMKHELIHAVGFKLALMIRAKHGIGKPRTLQGVQDHLLFVQILRLMLCAAEWDSSGWQVGAALKDPIGGLTP